MVQHPQTHQRRQATVCPNQRCLFYPLLTYQGVDVQREHVAKALGEIQKLLEQYVAIDKEANEGSPKKIVMFRCVLKSLIRFGLTTLL